MPSAQQAVLLVDDSVDTLEMYALALQLAGYRALTATNAERALGQLEHDHPDAVVTDILFHSGPDGWALIQQIRSNPATQPLPVVVLTGRVESAVAVNAKQAGCIAVLTKPCLPEDLVKVLQDVLRHGTAAV
jgi:CheY-like chemotaxis protein